MTSPTPRSGPLPGGRSPAGSPLAQSGGRLAADHREDTASPARSAALALRDRVADAVVARLAPDPAHRAALREHVYSRVRITSSDGGDPRALFVELGERGVGEARLCSPADPQRSASVDELLGDRELFARFMRGAPDGWQVPAPPAPPTDEQAALDDSEAFSPAPKNVRITAEQARDIRTYEQARDLARSRGGELIIEPEAPAAPPPSWVPNGKDVPLTEREACDLRRYERAKAEASRRGGSVVIVPDAARPLDWVEARDLQREAHDDFLATPRSAKD